MRHEFKEGIREARVVTVTKDRAPRDAALRRLRALAPLHPITLAGQALVLAARRDPADHARVQEMLASSSEILARTKGPADSAAVAALAAQALGDHERAIALAHRALGGKRLPKEAWAGMEKLSQAAPRP